MPYFSTSSKQKLKTCDPELQILFNYVIKYFDITIVCGERGREEQDHAFQNGFSTVSYPHSMHNKEPSLAVDAVPYPIEWGNTERMLYLIGFVLGVAQMLKDYGAIDNDVISGRDWDDDTILTDQRFNDFAHFEMKKQ